jgi:hypothetical protein
VRQLQSLYQYTIDRQGQKRVEVATLIRFAVNADKAGFDKGIRSLSSTPRKKDKSNVQTADSKDISKLGLGYSKSGD